MRKVKDLKDRISGQLIYPKSHAKATYLSNGDNVEDTLFNKQEQLIDNVNIATINGKSLLSSDDIDINQFIKNNIEKISESNVIFNENSPMKANAIYCIDTQVSSIEISALETDGEYNGDYAEYTIHFIPTVNMTLALRNDFYLANGDIPTFGEDSNNMYELSISAIKMNETFVYKVIIVPFKQIN